MNKDNPDIDTILDGITVYSKRKNWHPYPEVVGIKGKKKARAAINSLINREVLRGKIDELTWARDMAEKDITDHSLISENYVNERIKELRSEK